jgi:hypothetical protein
MGRSGYVIPYSMKESTLSKITVAGAIAKRMARKALAASPDPQWSGVQEVWCRRSLRVGGAGVVSPIKSPDALNA